MSQNGKGKGMKRQRLWAAGLLVIAMGQFGSEYAPMGWERVIDCSIRFLIALPLTLLALNKFRNTINQKDSK